MLGVIQIGLIDRSALAFVNRAGVAVPETLIVGAVKTDNLAAVVHLGEHAAVFDMFDRAGGAVVEPGFLIGLGELNAVAGGKGAAAVRAFKLVILPEAAELPVDFARALVQLGNVKIGV